MKTIKLSHLLVFMLCIFLTSCVSMSKYEALQKSKTKLKGKMADCETKRDSMHAALDACNSNVKKLQSELENMKTSKANAEKKYQSDLSSIKGELATMEQNYEALKSKSRGKMSELLKELESTQLDLKTREQKLKEVEAVLASMKSAITDLKASISDALLGFKDLGLSVAIKDGMVYVSLSEQLLFRSGSINVESKGKEALKGLAAALVSKPDIKILIEGHTDNVPISQGQIKDNWDLSVLRATAIVNILMENKELDPTRFIASGRGEYLPLVSNDSKENKAKNRRTEIILTPNLNKLYTLLNQ